jgi:hypothetical protein
MTNALTAADVRRILNSLDQIKELTDLLRRAHMDVPHDTVYGAAGGESVIREILLKAVLADVEVEQIGGSVGVPDALINTRDRGCADPVPGAIAPGDDPGVGGTVKVVPRVPS